MKAQKVSFPDYQVTDMLYELGGFLAPGESMMVTYEYGKYVVEFEHEENFNDLNMPEDLLKLLQRVS